MTQVLAGADVHDVGDAGQPNLQLLGHDLPELRVVVDPHAVAPVGFLDVDRAPVSIADDLGVAETVARDSRGTGSPAPAVEHATAGRTPMWPSRAESRAR